MSAAQKRSFTLPTEQASYIDRLVESGSYASASEVVRAGIRALQERDAAVDRWLREEVAPTYDLTIADPSRAQPAAGVFAQVRSGRRKKFD